MFNGGPTGDSRSEEGVRREDAESVARGPRSLLGGFQVAWRARNRGLGRRTLRRGRLGRSVHGSREERDRPRLRHQVSASVQVKILLSRRRLRRVGLLIAEIPQQDPS